MSHKPRIVAALIVWLLVPACSLASGIPKGSIAFAAEHDGGLHYVQPSSGQIHNIGFGQSNVSDLTYSESRKQLAFFASAAHGAPQSLYLLDLTTGRSTVLLSARENRNELYRPAFEPSGQYLYALNYDHGIYRYSFRTRQWELVKIVGREKLNFQGLSFSKSGRRAAISHGRFVGFLIAEVTPNGFRVEREVLTDFDSVISPRWLNDDVFVFAGRRKAGLQFLWKIDLNSGTVEQLTSAPLAARDFITLSADGKRVVFTGTKVGEPLEWRLWEVSTEKPSALQLTRGGKLSSHLFPTFID